MEFNYRYLGNSTVSTTSSMSEMSFVPDSLRQETFFRGILHPQKSVLFREAISALHDVVVDDQRYVPRDRSDYEEFNKRREAEEYQLFLAESEELKEKIGSITDELNMLVQEKNQLRRKSSSRNQAIQKYYNHLYKVNRDAWWVLDPVITIHPDTIFYECFSLDESSYGKLSCSYNCFDEKQQPLTDKACGTTNVDYSDNLYLEFQKIRDYRKTALEVDPTGFNVATENEDLYREPKIDLPDSWVRGFLQVSSAMALPSQKVRLHPQDIYIFCQILRTRNDRPKEPRFIRFELSPNQPVRAVFEPWGIVYECRRSQYYGKENTEIKIWGRRRLLILERLIPIAKHFDLHLLGTGMPYFFLADLGEMTFTLGLSGWTKNNFSDGANFDLLSPRGEVNPDFCMQVFDCLKESWTMSMKDLVDEFGEEEETMHSALSVYTQAGRVIYDKSTETYRARELLRDAINIEEFRFSSEEEKNATLLLRSGNVQNVKINQSTEGTVIDAVVRGLDGGTFPIHVVIQPNGSLDRKKMTCSCKRGRGQFRQGVCEHVLAGRFYLQERQKLNQA